MAVDNTNYVNRKKNKDNNNNNDDVEAESTVKMDRGLYLKLKTIVHKKKFTVKDTINELIKGYVAREELFKRYEPFLYVVNKNNRSIFIKDEKENKIVEIILKYDSSSDNSNKVLVFCNECKTDYCVHTAFATALPELGNLNIRKKDGK